MQTVLSSHTRRKIGPRVLLLAYACSPYRGSEYAVGWGRALQTAERYETWVLCGPESSEDIRRYAMENKMPPGLNFSFPELESDRGWLRRLPTVFAHNYIAIRFWHRQAYRQAEELHKKLRFDLVHHVNITGFREPGELWRLDAPFLWGPISGTQNVPLLFLPGLGPANAGKEALRAMVNYLQLHYSPRVKTAARKARIVISANSQIQREFANAQSIASDQLLETGIHQVAERPRPLSDDGVLRLLWCGELKAFKGLHLLLKALRHLPPDVRFRLRVLGKGPMLDRWRATAKRLKVAAHCDWRGFVPYSEILSFYDQADVFVFTSLRDTSGNVMLEALSRGVPVIGPAHQGAEDIITPDCGIRVPVRTPNAYVADLRDAIVDLYRNRNKLEALSEGALDRARSFLWSVNGQKMDELYRRLLAKTKLPMVTSGRDSVAGGDFAHA